MRTKKAGRYIILIAFAIVCLSKGIWLIFENSLDSTNYENRQLSIRPSLSVDNYETFFSDYTLYINDNLQFRNQLIELNSQIDYFCFRRSSNASVIIGKDNWLFYNSAADGNPLSCYQGTNLYSEEELASIANNCIAQRDFVESQGREFVIFIAPNKERIYSEFMPGRYGLPADNYRALQIYNYLKKNTDLRVVYPYSDLMEAKENIGYNIYYKTDTHWNYIGGYIGASALMKELGVDMPTLSSENISIVTEDETSGDLASFIHLNKPLMFADHEYVVEGYELHNCIETEYEFNGMWSFYAENADSRSIYVIRDSFSTHMAKYIGSQFSNSYLRHRNTYSYEDMISYNPDIVVYEVVERYVDSLATFSIN